MKTLLSLALLLAVVQMYQSIPYAVSPAYGALYKARAPTYGGDIDDSYGGGDRDNTKRTATPDDDDEYETRRPYTPKVKSYGNDEEDDDMTEDDDDQDSYNVQPKREIEDDDDDEDTDRVYKIKQVVYVDEDDDDDNHHHRKRSYRIRRPYVKREKVYNGKRYRDNGNKRSYRKATL